MLACIVAVACLDGPVAMAQDMRDAHDLAGFWAPVFEQGPVDREMLSHSPENTVLLDDTGAAEFSSGDFGGLDVKPEARAKAQEWDPQDSLTLKNVCATPSVIYSMQGPFPIEIHQTADVVVMRLEYFDQVRVIYLDGRDHPPADAPHSAQGHSIGHWEGDELVVDTTHILPSTLTNNGLDHSAGVHFVERYKLSADGKTLKSTQWFEDPAVLNNTGVRYVEWSARPGQYVNPYSCDPTFALDYSQVDPGQDVGADEFEVIN